VWTVEKVDDRGPQRLFALEIYESAQLTPPDGAASTFSLACKGGLRPWSTLAPCP